MGVQFLKPCLFYVRRRKQLSIIFKKITIIYKYVTKIKDFFNSLSYN